MLQDFAWSPHLDEMDGAVEGRCRNPNVVLQSDSLKLLVVERIPLNITPCYLRGDDAVENGHSDCVRMALPYNFFGAYEGFGVRLCNYLRAYGMPPKCESPEYGEAAQNVCKARY